jgi:hypothetical protein
MHYDINLPLAPTITGSVTTQKPELQKYIHSVHESPIHTDWIHSTRRWLTSVKCSLLLPREISTSRLTCYGIWYQVLPDIWVSFFSYYDVFTLKLILFGVNVSEHFCIAYALLLKLNSDELIHCSKQFSCIPVLPQVEWDKVRRPFRPYWHIHNIFTSFNFKFIILHIVQHLTFFKSFILAASILCACSFGIFPIKFPFRTKNHAFIKILRTHTHIRTGTLTQEN